MAEEVLQILLGRVPKSSPAMLDGFMRYSIRGKQYPIISQTHIQARVQGRLLHGITPQEIKILDLFEGDEYCRTEVVACKEDGNQVKVATYVATTNTFETLKDLLLNEWNYASFRTTHLESFLTMCTEFKNEL